MLIGLLLIVAGLGCGIFGLYLLIEKTLQRSTRIFAPLVVSVGATLLFSPLYLEFDDRFDDITVLVQNKETGRWEPHSVAWCPGDTCINVPDYIYWERTQPPIKIRVDDYDNFARSFVFDGGIKTSEDRREMRFQVYRTLVKMGFDPSDEEKVAALSRYGLTLSN